MVVSQPLSAVSCGPAQEYLPLPKLSPSISSQHCASLTLTAAAFSGYLTLSQSSIIYRIDRLFYVCMHSCILEELDVQYLFPPLPAPYYNRAIRLVKMGMTLLPVIM